MQNGARVLDCRNGRHRQTRIQSLAAARGEMKNNLKDDREGIWEMPKGCFGRFRAMLPPVNRLVCVSENHAGVV